MSALDTSPAVVDQVEVLFREARQRRRRRWLVGLGLALLVAALLAVTFAIVQSGGPSPRAAHRQSGLPEWSPPPGPNSAPPKEFVAGDNRGGIGVYATANGQLVRQLSAQTSGGPDQQAASSARGGSVYFVQPQGACSASIQSVPISGTRPSTTVVSVPGTMALDPAPSPDSSLLAWVGSICGSGGVQSTLYLSNQLTGRRSDLGPYFGRTNDEGIAWSHDGALLAAEAAPSIKVLHAGNSLSSARTLPVRSGCILLDPAFATNDQQLAVVRTCSAANGGDGSSELVMYNTRPGKPSALVAKLRSGEEFQSISADSSGHFLVGVSNMNGVAEIALVRRGHLISVSDHVPTGAQWITGRN